MVAITGGGVSMRSSIPNRGSGGELKNTVRPRPGSTYG